MTAATRAAEMCIRRMPDAKAGGDGQYCASKFLEGIGK